MTTKPDFSYELKHAPLLCAGVDEAGRGAWAGPVVAAAVILPMDNVALWQELNDSKKLSPLKRESLYHHIFQYADVGVGEANEQEIFDLNILKASLLAMNRAIENLSQKPEMLLIDGIHAPQTAIPAETIKKGDSHALSIAAASIIAKVTRDKKMEALEKIYSGYFFAAHKGYGTPQHATSLAKLGVSPIHRLGFKPIKCYVKK